MFTLIKQFWETHSIRSDPGLARVQARRARRQGREYQKELKAAQTLQTAFNLGQKEAIMRAVAAYAKIIELEIEDNEDIIIYHKTLLNRALTLLEQLERDIKSNPHAQDSVNLLRQIKEMEKKLQDSITNLLQTFTSFQNTNYSTMRVLDRASQIRDMFYQLRETRGEVRAFDKAVNSIDSAERAGKPVSQNKQIDAAVKSLLKELERQDKALNDAILLLNEIDKDVDKTKKLIETKRDHEDYPHLWAEENMKILDETHHKLNQWIEKEIAEGRVFLSKIQHAG